MYIYNVERKDLPSYFQQQYYILENCIFYSYVYTFFSLYVYFFVWCRSLYGFFSLSVCVLCLLYSQNQREK